MAPLWFRPLGIGRNNHCMGGRIENWKGPTSSSHVEASTIRERGNDFLTILILYIRGVTFGVS